MHASAAGAHSASQAAVPTFASETPTHATEAQGSLFAAATAHLDLDYFA